MDDELPPIPASEIDANRNARCVVCGLTKPLSAFEPSERNPGRPSASCKLCSKKPEAQRVVGGQRAIAKAARRGEITAVRQVTAEVADIFGKVRDMGEAQAAVNQMLPDLLRYLWAEAKAGNQAAIKQLLEVASGKSVPAGMGVTDPQEPSLDELLADEPGALTDSA